MRGRSEIPGMTDEEFLGMGQQFRHDDPITSWMHAQEYIGGHGKRLRLVLLRLAYEAGLNGVMGHELGHLLSRDRSTVSGIYTDLAVRGWIDPMGDRAMCPERDGYGQTRVITLQGERAYDRWVR